MFLSVSWLATVLSRQQWFSQDSSSVIFCWDLSVGPSQSSPNLTSVTPQPPTTADENRIIESFKSLLSRYRNSIIRFWLLNSPSVPRNRITLHLLLSRPTIESYKWRLSVTGPKVAKFLDSHVLDFSSSWTNLSSSLAQPLTSRTGFHRQPLTAISHRE